MFRGSLMSQHVQPSFSNMSQGLSTGFMSWATRSLLLKSYVKRTIIGIPVRTPSKFGLAACLKALKIAVGGLLPQHSFQSPDSTCGGHRKTTGSVSR
jgi:hypothetical protein